MNLKVPSNDSYAAHFFCFSHFKSFPVFSGWGGVGGDRAGDAGAAPQRRQRARGPAPAPCRYLCIYVCMYLCMYLLYYYILYHIISYYIIYYIIYYISYHLLSLLSLFPIKFLYICCCSELSHTWSNQMWISRIGKNRQARKTGLSPKMHPLPTTANDHLSHGRAVP